ncbi:hypothetical protein HMPREF9376_01583 [Enterococcus faecalis S613]|nr:hypothetical protein HMPREF9376_01583 [Enterococcus faecalis S613]
MTLKHKGVYTDYSGGFGTILNNMTLKLGRGCYDGVVRFGTILNNMTLKLELHL